MVDGRVQDGEPVSLSKSTFILHSTVSLHHILAGRTMRRIRLHWQRIDHLRFSTAKMNAEIQLYPFSLAGPSDRLFGHATEERKIRNPRNMQTSVPTAVPASMVLIFKPATKHSSHLSHCWADSRSRLIQQLTFVSASRSSRRMNSPS